MTDKPTSEPRPPIYPAEWLTDQTKSKEIKCKTCNRVVRPECIWTSCPWKDNWHGATGVRVPGLWKGIREPGRE